MIHLGKDIKLNICPILVTLHHDYVFEGPCRMGKDFELTKEFDDMANAQLIKGAHEEIAENLTSHPDRSGSPSAPVELWSVHCNQAHRPGFHH